ncbi:hypothetical protein BDW68DRAFT_152735, partial [Aspergillus falconensis]
MVRDVILVSISTIGLLYRVVVYRVVHDGTVRRAKGARAYLRSEGGRCRWHERDFLLPVI